MKRFLVVGGGLSGLSAAWRLRELVGPEHEITVFESAQQGGGKALTIHEEGWLVERGPSAFLLREGPLTELVQGLGLEDALVGPAARARLLYSKGAIRQVTANPFALVWRGLLTPGEAARLCAEPFISSNGPGEESVFDFAARRFGAGVAEGLVAPMLLGISAGAAREVSVDAVFPEWSQLEASHGSMVRAAMARSGSSPRMVGLRGGNQGLTRALIESGRFELRCGHQVTGFDVTKDQVTVGFAEQERVTGEGLIVALPTQSAARLWSPGPVATALNEVLEPPMLVAAVGFPSEHITLPAAFGVLVARDQGLRSLGILFESALFPDRAPAGQTLVRVLLGGGADPTVAELDEVALKALVLRELEAILGVSGAPSFWRLIRWPEAIPVGGLGHRERRQRIEQALGQEPRLALAGTGIWGIGVEKAVTSGFRAAEQLQPGPL